ncbi:hypothetical protein GCM10008171_17150 [Methylopila jiangsuensis]|uniref:Uncharacterized protein n=1 Tax=Methylopila jiangsuensis TaxID=586230 RepID=A0A9W6JHD5_9HYPH|nr:hypothetical protein GCM10008171_17150 [Methylopila jiangsuensis]
MLPLLQAIRQRPKNKVAAELRRIRAEQAPPFLAKTRGVQMLKLNKTPLKSGSRSVLRMLAVVDARHDFNRVRGVHRHAPGRCVDIAMQ